MTDTTDAPPQVDVHAARSGHALADRRRRRLITIPVVAGLVLAGVFGMPVRAGAALTTTAHQRQVLTGASAASSATFSATVPAGVSTVAGRHLVLAYLFSGAPGETVTAISDTKGNTYRIDAVRSNSGSNGLTIVVASARISAPLTAGDTVNVTQSTTTTYHAIQLYEFDNFTATSWADRTATGNSASSTTAVSTASTSATAQANETLVAAVAAGDKPATLTSASGWTDSDTVTAGPTTKQKTLGLAVRDVTATGSYGYAGTLSTADQSVSALVTYRSVETDPGAAPTASFTASPTSGYAPLDVQFADTSTGTPTSWSWTFGDGTGSSQPNPAHRYASAGTYTVSLTVSNDAGTNTATRSGLITAQPGSIGYQDMSTAGSGGAASGEKPTSKLWFNDGSWWGVLFDSVSRTHHIFRLNRITQTWIDTGVRVDDRPGSRADVLWDGQRLYVASALFASSSTSGSPGNPARLYRFGYDVATDTYSLDSGFPVAVGDYSTEALTIDKDTSGTVWAAWVQGAQVYVNRSTVSDASWGTPTSLAGLSSGTVQGATGLDPDDIAAVVAFGTKVGIMWSNQVASAMYFAVHDNGDPVDVWQAARTAVQGPKSADDHINLKTLQGDPAGRVFAAVKTSLDDSPGTPTSAPQILVVGRDPASGDWSSAPFGRVSDCHTRPVLMLDSQRQVLHVFATAPEGTCQFAGQAGTIFEKTSPMSNLSFPLGKGTPVIRDIASPNMNNVTSSKQSVADATGLVVVATNDVTKRYWHADVALG
jgi:PKD repeat protein